DRHDGDHPRHGHPRPVLLVGHPTDGPPGPHQHRRRPRTAARLPGTGVTTVDGSGAESPTPRSPSTRGYGPRTRRPPGRTADTDPGPCRSTGSSRTCGRAETWHGDGMGRQPRSITVSRVVDAPAARVFAFLADPANHVALDTSGMVRGA